MSRCCIDDQRYKLAAWIVGGLFVFAAASQARVHVIKRDEIIDLANDTRRFVVRRDDVARRGTILDRNGNVLAQSDDRFELSIDFARRVPASQGFYVDLGLAAGVSPGEVAQAALVGKRNLIWRKTLSHDRSEAVRDVKERWRADGVSLRRVHSREFSLGTAAAGVVGSFIGENPVAGIEKAKNKELSGQNGFREGLVDRTGAFLPMRMTDRSSERRDGQSIVLTLDSDLQVAAASAIRQAVEKNKAESGVAIVMDPTTGDVLAMADWPSFDPNAPYSTPRANPAFMKVFEPGSTFKILTLAKALEDGKTTPGKTINCRGELHYNAHWRIRCDLHHGTRAHGTVNAERAIAKSCNVSAATWALGVGRDEFIDYMKALGLLEKPGLGMPLETAGLFKMDEYAKQLQLMNVGFGQSLSATPLALASAFSTLANSGVRMKPRLVKSIGGEPQPLREYGRVLRTEIADEVLQMMESVIGSDEGTGATLRIAGYRLAGKTGTAQKIGFGTGHVSSFVGYVPAVRPKAVILTMVDNPKAGAYYGALVAGPVFRELAQAVIKRYQIPPSEARP